MVHSRLHFALLAVAVLGTVLVSPLRAAPDPIPAAPAWDKLKAAYDVDTKRVPVVTETPQDNSDYLQVHLTFTDVRGEAVTGTFLRPKADGIYPVALVLHGLGSSKEGTLEFFGKQLLAKGIACIALDAPLHGERKKEGKTPRGPEFVSVVRDGVWDYRELMTWLTARKDVDKTRIGLIGNSMGAMMGAILTSVEDRIAAAALTVGGDPFRSALATVPEGQRSAVEFASPSSYIGHISPRPVFLINARGDKTMSEPAALRLQKAANEPKTIIWVEGDHVLPLSERQKAVDWLSEKLKSIAVR